MISAKGRSRGGGSGLGCPEEGIFPLLFPRGDNTTTILQDKEGHNRRMQGGTCWTEKQSVQKCGIETLCGKTEAPRWEPRVWACRGAGDEAGQASRGREQQAAGPALDGVPTPP